MLTDTEAKLNSCKLRYLIHDLRERVVLIGAGRLGHAGSARIRPRAGARHARDGIGRCLIIYSRSKILVGIVDEWEASQRTARAAKA
jgi:hypothetical protein